MCTSEFIVQSRFPWLPIVFKSIFFPSRQTAIKYCVIKGIITTALTALAFHEGLSFEVYFALLYIPGTFFFIISVLLPVFFRDALHLVGDPV